MQLYFYGYLFNNDLQETNPQVDLEIVLLIERLFETNFTR